MVSKLLKCGIFSLTLSAWSQHGQAFTCPSSCLFFKHALKDLGKAQHQDLWPNRSAETALTLTLRLCTQRVGQSRRLRPRLQPITPSQRHSRGASSWWAWACCLWPFFSARQLNPTAACAGQVLRKWTLERYSSYSASHDIIKCRF